MNFHRVFKYFTSCTALSILFIKKTKSCSKAPKCWKRTKWNYNYIGFQGVNRDICPLELLLCGHIEAAGSMNGADVCALVIQVDIVLGVSLLKLKHDTFATREKLACNATRGRSPSLSLSLPACLPAPSINFDIGQQVCMANRSTQKCLLNFGAQSRLEGIIVWLTGMKPGHKAKLLSGFSGSQKKNQHCNARRREREMESVLGGPSNSFHSLSHVWNIRYLSIENKRWQP